MPKIHGANVNNWSSDKLGSHLGYMPQDVELFRGTVAENISRFQEVDLTRWFWRLPVQAYMI